MEDNKIIDVAFKELTVEDLESKTLEELRVETNSLYQQMELIGNIGMMIAARAGRMLCVMKEKVPYGEWESWCKENLNFSKRKAENMMKLSSRVDDSDSLFSKTQIFAEVGISKVWELLSAPEEVVKEVTENTNIEEVSVKELKEEIATYKSALSNQEEIRKEKEGLESKIKELEKQLEEASAPETIIDEEAISKIADELEHTKDELQKTKDSIRDQIKAEKKKIEEKNKKEMESAIEEARVQALKDASVQADMFRGQVLDLEDENEKLKKMLENSNNEDIVSMKLNGERLQNDFQQAIETLERIKQSDPDRVENTKSYLKAIVASMAEQLGGI